MSRLRAATATRARQEARARSAATALLLVLACGCDDAGQPVLQLEAGIGVRGSQAVPAAGDPLNCFELSTRRSEQLAAADFARCERDEDCVFWTPDIACPQGDVWVGDCPRPIAAARLDAAQRWLAEFTASTCPRVEPGCKSGPKCRAPARARCVERSCVADDRPCEELPLDECARTECTVVRGARVDTDAGCLQPEEEIACQTPRVCTDERLVVDPRERVWSLTQGCAPSSWTSGWYWQGRVYQSAPPSFVRPCP